MASKNRYSDRSPRNSLMWAVWDLQKDLEGTYAVHVVWTLVQQEALRGRYVVRIEARSPAWASGEKPLESYSRLYPSSDLTSLEGALFSGLNRLAKQLDDRRRELMALAGF